jgi:hypothetical protein
MNLGEFHSNVETALNRGTTLTTRIPGRVKQAVMWLERNYTFSHMERFRLLQVVALDRTVDLPSNEIIKGFKFCRFINGDGSYRYLNKINPQDSLGIVTKDSSAASSDITPSAFWTIGNQLMVFNAVPSANMTGEAMWWSYTDWPTDLASEHALLSVASDVLLAQTLMFLAAFDLRDMRMMAAWKELRDEGVNTLTRAEDEAQYSGQSISMVYVP